MYTTCNHKYVYDDILVLVLAPWVWLRSLMDLKGVRRSGSTYSLTLKAAPRSDEYV